MRQISADMATLQHVVSLLWIIHHALFAWEISQVSMLSVKSSFKGLSVETWEESYIHDRDDDELAETAAAVKFGICASACVLCG